MTNAASDKRLRTIVALGKARLILLGSLVLGVVVIMAFAAGRRAGPPSQTAAAPGTAPTLAAHITSFQAPAADSLETPILDSSTAVLAPGATLSIADGFVNPMGARQWDATLSGTARFTIRGDKRDLAIRTPAGHTTLPYGTFEVSATPTALIVHTLASGRPALLYKPHGLFSWIPRRVPADDVGTADNAHWKPRVSLQR